MDIESIIALIIAVAASGFTLYRVWRGARRPLFKILWSAVALVPFLGPITYLIFCASLPDPQNREGFLDMNSPD